MDCLENNIIDNEIIFQNMKPITTKPTSGLAIHCHHDILAEYCYDYDVRVEEIKNKPKHEVKTRLRLFRILPDKAKKDFPERYLKAYAEWNKANVEWDKVNAEWEKANAEWPQESRDAFHKKWCGCEKWNGTKLVFGEKV